jgi:hypothetical protein
MMPRCALSGVLPPDPGVIGIWNIAHSSALMQSRYGPRRSLDQAVSVIFLAAFAGNRLFLGRTND